MAANTYTDVEFSWKVYFNTESLKKHETCKTMCTVKNSESYGISNRVYPITKVYTHKCTQNRVSK